MSKLGKEGTKWSFLSLIKLEKDKLANSVCLPQILKRSQYQKREIGNGDAVGWNLKVLE